MKIRVNSWFSTSEIVEGVRGNLGLAQKLAISKKSTILIQCSWYSSNIKYRTRAINNRGFYYFFHFLTCWLFFDVWQHSFEIVQLLNKSSYYQRAVRNCASTVSNFDSKKHKGFRSRIIFMTVAIFPWFLWSCFAAWPFFESFGAFCGTSPTHT